MLALLLFDLVRAGDERAIGAESACSIVTTGSRFQAAGTVLMARLWRLLVGMD